MQRGIPSPCLHLPFANSRSCFESSSYARDMKCSPLRYRPAERPIPDLIIFQFQKRENKVAKAKQKDLIGNQHGVHGI